MIRKILALIAAALLAVAAFASPAQAGATNPDCFSGELCLYTQTWYAGGMKIVLSGHCVDLDGSYMDNNMESLQNHTGHYIEVYDWHNCDDGGWVMPVAAHQEKPFFTISKGYPNDAGSIRIF